MLQKYIYIKKKNKEIEIPILEKLTNLVRMDICPHFPILYGYVLCDKRDNNNKDSFVKSDSKDKSIIQKVEKLPKFVKHNSPIDKYYRLYLAEDGPNKNSNFQ